MKCQGSLVLLAAIAGLASADCNANNCLRAVIGKSYTTRNGALDCSSLLAVTVTPATSTATSTITVLPTVYTTVVGTDVATTTQTTTVSTETARSTTQITQTASTETDFTTATVTQGAPTLKARVATPCVTPTYPAYASPCSAWVKYVSACSCVGVLPTTVKAPTPVTTAVVYETTTITSSILTTASTTETAVISVTASTATTETQIISVTDTTLATITQTVVPTVTPAPVATCVAYTGAFKAHATQNGGDLFINGNFINPLQGSFWWNSASSSTSATVQNKFIWAIDGNGYLYVAYSFAPYNYVYYAYMITSGSGSNWPQLDRKSVIDTMVSRGSASYVKACVNPDTMELQLDAGGRTSILWCGGEMWMGYGKGEDINRGVCVQMFPTIVPV